MSDVEESRENPPMEIAESSSTAAAPQISTIASPTRHLRRRRTRRPKESDEEYNTVSSGSSDEVSADEAAAATAGNSRQETVARDSSPASASSSFSSAARRRRAVRFLARTVTSRRTSRSSSTSSEYSTPSSFTTNDMDVAALESGGDSTRRRCHTAAASSSAARETSSAAVADSSSDNGEAVAAAGDRSAALDVRLASSSSSLLSSSNESLNGQDPELQDEDDTGQDPEVQGSARRRWPRRRTLTAEEEAKYDTTPKCPRPAHKWNAVVEMDRRGIHGKAGLFQSRCYGSLRCAERLELMAKLDGHLGCVNSVSFCPEGHLLASGSDDLQCMIWEWQKNRSLLIFETGHRSNVFQTKFLPNRNNTAIVTAARDGAVRLHELCDGGSAVESSRKIAFHRGAVHKVAMHYSMQETVMSTGEDGVVNEIDLRLPNPNALLTVRNDRSNPVGLYSIAINPCRPFEFCTAGLDRYVRVFDRRNAKLGETVRKLCPLHLVGARMPVLSVSCAVYNFDGSEVLATYSDEDIYIFNNHPPHDDHDQEYLKRFQGHRNNQTVKSVNYFGLRSEYVVSGSDCGHIFVWDKRTTHIVNCLHGDEGGVVNVLEPNPCAPYLATSGFDHNVKIWAPSADEPPDLAHVRMHTMENMRQRERDMYLDDEFSASHRDRSQLVLYLMDLLPVRRMAGLETAREDSNNWPETSSDEDVQQRPQCPPS